MTERNENEFSSKEKLSENENQWFSRVGFVAFDFNDQFLHRNIRSWAIQTPTDCLYGECSKTDWNEVRDELKYRNIQVLYVRGYKAYRFVRYLFPKLIVIIFKGIKFRGMDVYSKTLKRRDAYKKARLFHDLVIESYSNERSPSGTP